MDFNADEVKDQIVTDSTSDEQPGTVEIRSGDSGSTMLRMSGREGWSRFGSAVAVIGDVDGDGIPDVLVGSPKEEDNGVAYVFSGEILECHVELEPQDAIGVFRPIPGDTSFGFAVAPLYDFDGDGIPDFRVAAQFEDAQQNLMYRTYIYAGSSGDLIKIVTGSGDFAALKPIDGDADCDGQINQDDMDRVLNNFGRSGDVTRYDGDVNDDNTVDSLDVALVTTKQGFRAFDTATSPNTCSPSANCISISPDQSVYCLCEPPELGELAATIEVVDGFNTSSAVIVPVPGACNGLIEQCLNDYRVLAALALVDARCLGAGGAPSVIAKIYCKNCGPNEDNETQMICDFFGRRIKIKICTNTVDFCASLAHEITHASQGCANGLFNGQCSAFNAWKRNFYHRMCAELEANQTADQCNGIEACCARACLSVRNWDNCHVSCVDCCIASHGCCSNGRNVCEDNGTNPCR